MQYDRGAAPSELEFEPIAPASTAAAFAVSGLSCGGPDAFERGLAGAVLRGVAPPGLRAISASLVVAVQQLSLIHI